MKKLLYLVPFILIGLSVLPISLYKDKVDFLLSKNPNAKIEDLSGALTKLSPSHWKMIDYQVSASADLGSASFSFDSSDAEATTEQQTPEVPKPEPLYQGAKFHGFPFGAYFSKSSSTNTANSKSSYSASGYSWLWVAVDLLLIVASLVISFKVNRKKKTEPIAAPTQPLAQPTSNPDVTPIDQPQATAVQSNVITPSQPVQTQPPQTVQPTQQPQPPEDNQNQPQ